MKGKKGRSKEPLVLATNKFEVTSEPAPELVDPLVCCGQHMKRLNCGGDDLMCPHFRWLTDKCDKCYKDQNGRMVWGCSKCKREKVEGSDMFGPAALAVNFGYKRDG